MGRVSDRGQLAPAHAQAARQDVGVLDHEGDVVGFAFKRWKYVQGGVGPLGHGEDNRHPGVVRGAHVADEERHQDREGGIQDRGAALLGQRQCPRVAVTVRQVAGAGRCRQAEDRSLVKRHHLQREPALCVLGHHVARAQSVRRGKEL